jgi:hypothetical protein
VTLREDANAKIEALRVEHDADFLIYQKLKPAIDLATADESN